MSGIDNQFDFSWAGAAMSSAIASFVTWFFARRKNTADAIKAELDNVHQIAGMWREQAEKQNEQIKEQNKQIMELQHQLNNVRTQLNGLYKYASNMVLENTRMRLALKENGITWDSLFEDEEIPNPPKPTEI